MSTSGAGTATTRARACQVILGSDERVAHAARGTQIRLHHGIGFGIEAGRPPLTPLGLDLGWPNLNDA